jgi:polysaccharide pyruvyl transferase WcaK-like protein
VKVALLTPYDGGNLGDAAVQEALIGNFRKYDAQVQLYGITLDPESTAARHHIPCYPLAAISRPYYHAKKGAALSPSDYTATSHIERSAGTPGLFARIKGALRSFLFRIGLKPLVRLVQECLHILRSSRLLRRVDTLVVAGGGQLDQEWGGSWGHPYALMKWAVLARAAGASVIFLSVGACRTDSWLTKLFLRTALSLACYRSYRDEGSRQLARAITPTADGPVVPDLAFSLSLIAQPSTANTNSAGLRVGVSPIAYARTGMWPAEDRAQYERYMNELASFVVALLRRGIFVTLFSSSSPDDQLFDDLRARIDPSLESEARARLLFGNVTSVQDLLVLLHSVDFIVASRLHGLVLSFLAGTPSIALSYDRKVETLMTDVGMKAYCLDIRSFTSENLLATFLSLQTNGPVVESKLMATCCHYDQLLQSQYRLVTELRLSGLSSSQSSRALVASDERLCETRSDVGPHG